MKKIIALLITIMILVSSSGALASGATPQATDVIWRGDAETGDTSQWCKKNEGVPGRISVVNNPVVQGQYAYRFQLNDGDSIFNSERVTLSQECAGRYELNGEEKYYGWSVFLPADYPTNTSWSLVVQWKGIHTGAPPISLNLRNDKWILNNRPNTSSGENHLWTASMTRGRWENFVMHVKWSTDPTIGFIELWYNGVLVVPKFFTSNIHGGSSPVPNFVAMGLYRDASISSNVVLYHDGFVVGRTYASVTGEQPPITVVPPTITSTPTTPTLGAPPTITNTPPPTSTGVIPPTPIPGSGIHFAVIGDYGNGSANETNVANLVKSWNPEFVITTGDNNYESGAASTIDKNIGRDYHEFIGNYTGTYGAGSTTNRFFPSLGNHDCPSAPYVNYFTLPGNERYYDFVKGDVHFYAINSACEADGASQTSTQALWLKGKLAASTSRWDVVYFHHPAYSSGSNHGSTIGMRWPFATWGAEVVMSGHDHTYERLSKDGIPYFVNGLGGKSIYGLGTPLAGSQVRYNAAYGAMLVDADANAMTFRFINVNGVVIDTFTIPSGVPVTPPIPTNTSSVPTPTRTPTLLATSIPTFTPSTLEISQTASIEPATPQITPTRTPPNTPRPTATVISVARPDVCLRLSWQNGTLVSHVIPCPRDNDDD